MSRQAHIKRARELLDTQPTGLVTPATSTPWMIKAICFLLFRYLGED